MPRAFNGSPSAAARLAAAGSPTRPLLRSGAVSVPAPEQMRILRSGTAEIVPEEELAARLERSVETGVPLRAKLGIDPSSPDIHLGHAVVLRKLRRFQQFGHTAVLIIGDFTGMVGDPTGRSEMRKVLSENEVRSNAETYVEQVKKILLPEPLEVVWNSEWLATLGTAGLLRLASKMTVARMLERDDFRRRYEGGTPISLIEFMYPLLQGYDSVAVRADVELGGTDQTFNLLVGRDLQRDAGQTPQIAFTTPLLEGLDGVQKMSKSLGNYVGVTDPPAEMYGKLMRVPDELIGKYLRLTTDLDPAEIDALEAEAGEPGPKIAAVKRRLASAVVEIYHGTAAALEAASRFDAVHVSHEIPSDVPEAQVPAGAVRENGLVRPAPLLVGLGMATSNSDALRLILQGGVKLDGTPLTDGDLPLEALNGRVLQVGRRKFVRLLPPRS